MSDDDDEWEDELERELTDAPVLMAMCLALEGEQRFQESTRGQHYLRRSDSLPDPRRPWEAVYAEQSDAAFITTTCFDVATFHYMLEPFEKEWNSRPVPRNNVPSEGVSRPARRSLSAAGALGLLVHHLSSTTEDQTLQQVFAVTRTVCSRYIRFALEVLLSVLRKLPDASIAWPNDEGEYAQYGDMIRLQHPLLDGAFCFVDGLNLPVAESLDETIQNAYYNGWTCDYYCSRVFAFAPNGRIIFASLNAPGSWHDAAIARQLYENLDRRTPPGYYAIADTAFPRNELRVQDRIRVPLKKKDKRSKQLQEEGRFQEFRALKAFNSVLVSARLLWVQCVTPF